jgi:two-component system chemotaxis response regulator CheB
LLPQIIQRRCELEVHHAHDGERIQAGHIYTAPPDHHLLVEESRVRVVHGPKENGFRPAVDPLFRSASAAYGARVIGLVLSGALDDGTYGLMLIKQAGGIALVQHPEEAFMASMPLSAVQHVAVDEILRTAQIAKRLVELSRLSLPEGAIRMAKHKENGNRKDPTQSQPSALETGELPGSPSAFTCPECGGALWELTEGNLFRYRCHVGHSFSPDTLLTQKSEYLEAALWTALRALEETAALHRRLAQRTHERGLTAISDTYTRKSEEYESRAELIRQVLFQETP